MSAAAPAGQIVVLAGTNGAGKSSIAGEALRGSGSEYFNPDEVTRRILATNPGLALDAANSIAWRESLGRLQKAIAEGSTYAFETTLGGNTVPATLLDAAQAGTPVRIFYVGLASVERHIERVRRRVARGGHDIPEERIRVRYDNSRKNLVKLLPYLAELVVFDNTTEADPIADQKPQPRKILQVKAARIEYVCPPDQVPDWCKPIVQAALRLERGRRGC